MNTLLFAAVVARDKDGFDLFGVEDARQAHGRGEQQVQSVAGGIADAARRAAEDTRPHDLESNGNRTMSEQGESGPGTSRATQPSRPVEIEKSLDRLSWLLDDLFRIPGLGWRVGLDALVGLVPGVGDTATTVASLYVLAAAARYRVPKITLLRMGLNLGIDYALGSLPLVGDLFDAWWKANQKNLALLRQRATVSTGEARTGRFGDWLFVGFIVILLVAIAAGATVVSLFLLASVARRLWPPSGG